jgi:hypothetical protein
MSHIIPISMPGLPKEPMTYMSSGDIKTAMPKKTGCRRSGKYEALKTSQRPLDPGERIGGEYYFYHFYGSRFLIWTT